MTLITGVSVISLVRVVGVVVRVVEIVVGGRSKNGSGEDND